MAVTLAAPPVTDSLTMDATAGNVLQVNCHQNTRSLVLTFVDANGRIADAGTDGAAVGDDYDPVLPNQAWVHPISNGRARVLGGRTIYLASDTNSSVVKVQVR